MPRLIWLIRESGREKFPGSSLALREGGDGRGAVVEDGIGGGESREVEDAFDLALKGADGEVAAFAREGAADHEELAETGAGGVFEAGEVHDEMARGFVLDDFFEDGVELLPIVRLDAAVDFENGDGSFVGGVVFGHGGWDECERVKDDLEFGNQEI